MSELCAHATCPLDNTQQVRWTPEAAEDVQDVWRALPGLLSAGHVWVRKAASRLLGHAFADKATGAHLPSVVSYSPL